MNPAAAVALGVGVALVLKSLVGGKLGGGGGARLFMQGKTQFWTPDSAPALRAVLSRSRLVPSGTERVFEVQPGAGALADVQAMRMRGNVVQASVNLTDPARKTRCMLAEVTPEQFMNLETGTQTAVLPNL